jgi:hypothetical protein
MASSTFVEYMPYEQDIAAVGAFLWGPHMRVPEAKRGG